MMQDFREKKPKFLLTDGTRRRHEKCDYDEMDFIGLPYLGGGGASDCLHETVQAT